jgi:CheY-like chemotaxis protein
MFPDNEPRAVNATTVPKRVLFVDDDQNVLDEIERTLLDTNSDYERAFTSSGREALRKLEESAFDIVVADMHMPEIGGAELLTEVTRLYPQTVRILLSDNAGLDLVLRSSSTAHQFLTKPCDAATLRRTLDRALRIREMLASPGLRTVVSRMTTLPTLPAMYTKLVESLDDPEISSRKLGEIIAQDVGMSAKILQIANSAFFGLSLRGQSVGSRRLSGHRHDPGADSVDHGVLRFSRGGAEFLFHRPVAAAQHGHRDRGACHRQGGKSA